MPTAIDYARRGHEFQTTGEFAKAISYYTEALRLDPNLVNAHGCRGECYSKLQQYDVAIADFSKEIRLNPGQGQWLTSLAQAFFQRGLAHLKARNYDAAILDISESARLAPVDAAAAVNNELGRVYYVRAQHAFQQRDFEGALFDVRTAIQLCPAQADEWRPLEKNILWFSEPTPDTNENAKNTLSEVEADQRSSTQDKLLPQNANEYFQAGIAYQQAGDYAAAEQAYTESLQMDANHVNAYVNRAELRFSRTDYSGAIADYTQAIQLDPTLATAYQDRGSLYAATGDYDHTIADLTEAIRLDWRLAEAINVLLTDAYSHRANESEAQGRLEQAFEDICAALEIQSVNADTLRDARSRLAREIQLIKAKESFRQGLTLHQVGDLAAADQHYTDALRFDPDYLDAYAKRAELRYARRNYDGAIADYSEVIRLAPKMTAAYWWRALLYHTRARGNLDGTILRYNQDVVLDLEISSDLDRALLDYNRAIDLDPKNAGLHSSRGRAYFDNGEYDLAIADYDQAIRLNPKEIVAYVNRGDALVAKGQKMEVVQPGDSISAELFRKAVPDYEQAIRLGLNDDSVQRKLTSAQLMLGAYERPTNDRAIQRPAVQEQRVRKRDVHEDITLAQWEDQQVQEQQVRKRDVQIQQAAKPKAIVPGSAKRDNSRPQTIDIKPYISQLTDFVNVEADAQKEDLDRVWSLSLEERVAKGEAIANIEIAIEEREVRDRTTREKHHIKEIVLRYAENRSKFRKGDLVFLNKGDPRQGGVLLGLPEDLPAYGEVRIPANSPLIGDYKGAGRVLDRGVIDNRSILLQALSQVTPDSLIANILFGDSTHKTDQVLAQEAKRQIPPEFVGNPAQIEAFINGYSTDSYYVIQGPPGTGKTTVLAHLAVALARSGEHVLITAMSHEAINNALNAVARLKQLNSAQVFKIGSHDKEFNKSLAKGIKCHATFCHSPYGCRLTCGDQQHQADILPSYPTLNKRSIDSEKNLSLCGAFS